MWKKLLAALAMYCAAAMAMAAVDVNKATEADLDALKGIGPVTSKLILNERKKGSFKDWQDFITRVKGVGESRAAKFSEEGLTVNGQAFKAAAAKDAKADAKAEKKEAKAEAKADKKEARAEAKADRKEAKADAAKPAASAAKPAASAAKPAASAKK